MDKLIFTDQRTKLIAYDGKLNPYSAPLTIGEIALSAADVDLKYQPRKILLEIFEKLAAYENTGFEPEQISAGTTVTFDIGNEGFLKAINAAFKERFGITADDVPKIIAERDKLKESALDPAELAKVAIALQETPR